MLKLLRKLLRRKTTEAPLDPRAHLQSRYPDFTSSTIDTILAVEPFTMTSPERIEALCGAVEYLCRSRIAGDVVECGVWRGGSMMAVASMLLREGDHSRQLHLYDTYEGMPPAEDVDKDFLDADASELLSQQDKQDPESIWCYSGLDEVQRNMQSTSYPQESIQFIKGKVEDTLSGNLPDSIALLRLDTDWYESTKVCLEQLYPRLVPGGVLIIDDYGHWQGCRKAVDEYFIRHSVAIHLNRIDYTGRIAIKPGTPQVASVQLSA